uniref:HAMP domain-containing protein n=1 Tax=Salinibacter altiplanensis TaxID=1803181 RepID=UPI001F2ECBBE
MLNRLSESLRAKLIVGFAVPFVVLVLFVSIYYPLSQRTDSLNAARNQVGELSEMVALSVGTGLADSNYDLVKKAFDWATADSKVRYVAILDEDEETLFDHNPDEIQVETSRLLQTESTIREGGLLRTSHPIEYGGKSYGNVVLAYSLEEAMSEIWSETLLTIFINLLILGLGIGVVLWLSGRISGRIRRVRDGAQAISEGNLDVEIPMETDDEIGELAGGFNEMVRDIRTTQEALEEEKASVERRVEEAVRESEQQRERLEESVD